MRFFKAASFDEIYAFVDKRVSALGHEEVILPEACGRVVVQDVEAPVDFPLYHKSTVDGYAVKSVDTYGASEASLVHLELAGNVLIGELPSFKITQGKAISIPTGGILPEGSDAVVMVEFTEQVDENTILITKSVAPWENVITAGEDFSAGEIILRCGQVVSPIDIGVMAAFGITKLPVVRLPKVVVFSTGNELVSPYTEPSRGQIRDINGFSIMAFVRRLGCKCVYGGILPDEFEVIKNALIQGIEDSNMVILSGGSSVGVRDLTIDVLNSFEDMDLVFHGVMMKPGKPTIVAKVKERIVIGLPGHPASAVMVFIAVVQPILMKMMGIYRLCNRKKWDSFPGVINRNVASKEGREDFVMVRMLDKTKSFSDFYPEFPVVEPLLGKSGLLSPLCLADGYIRIPANKEGIEAGARVEVFPLHNI